MKQVLKTWLPASARRRVRRFGRVRWLTKARVVRSYGHRPATWWRYVLLDPEVDSFTYPILNRDELAATLAAVLGVPRDAAAGALAETDTDPVLRAALTRPLHRLPWAKRRAHPRAYHQACWAIVRLTRPAEVVETGVLDGMASTVLLAALARNAAEGAPGRLTSFDVMPGAGAAVPRALRGGWRRHTGDAADALPHLIGSARVGFLASDSLADAGQIRRELDAVLAHRAPVLVALTTWGALADLGWPAGTVRFSERPAGHFAGGTTLALARL